jgi:peptidoglycan/xylan/chitin deacetylase (PgdA/CDA1 family)
VRVILRRGGAAVAFLAACVAMVQVGDFPQVSQASAASPADAQTSILLRAQVPFGMAPERAITIHHTMLIPFGRHSISVPILMYHYIRPLPSLNSDWMGYKLSVSPANFTQQMDWLATNGYHPVDFADLRAYFAGTRVLQHKPVVITLDDGYADLYTTAYPILKTYNFKAVAYIVTTFVGTPRYVTADQVIEMDHNGIQIASHTLNHVNLARTSAYWVTYQLATSKSWLERLLGHPVVDFAYPSGKFSSQAVYALQATGYDTAVTEMPGTMHSRDDRYTWTRVRVGGGESMADFVDSLGPVEVPLVLTTINTGPGD